MNNTTNAKKIPLRRCIGCGESFDKRSLIRIVHTPDDEIKIDLSGKLNGRGAYLCNNAICLKKALKKGRLSDNLNCAIPETVIATLEEQIK